MKLTIVIMIFTIAISAQIPIIPNFPAYQITVNDDPSSGQLLFSTFNSYPGQNNPPFLAIMNNDGTFVYTKQLLQSAFDFKMQPNGNYTYYDSNKGVFYEMNNHFDIIDSFFTQNGYFTDLHELRILPNGNALILGQDFQNVDMSRTVQGGNPNAVVIGCRSEE